MNKSIFDIRSLLTAATIAILLASAVLIVLPGSENGSAVETPTKGIGVYRNGPIVNRSVVILDGNNALKEGFDDIEDFLNRPLTIHQPNEIICFRGKTMKSS